MILPASMLGPLAEVDARAWADALRRGFIEECASSDGYALLVAAAVLGGLLLTLFLTRSRDSRTIARTDYLVAGARRLGLGHLGLRDLKTVARRARLPHPAVMLLSPANLAHAVRTAEAVVADPPLRRRLDRLSVHLFGRKRG